MKDRDLSGADLARFAGVTRQYVSQIRAGDVNPRDTHANAIERALGVPHGALFDYGDEPADAVSAS